jgi:hypothetical protein
MTLVNTLAAIRNLASNQRTPPSRSHCSILLRSDNTIFKSHISPAVLGLI